VNWLQDLLKTLFYSVVVLVLLNLLIAIMSKTYSVLSSYNAAFFLMEKHRITEYLEQYMDEEELVEHKLIYSNKSSTAAPEDEDSTVDLYTYEMREIMQDWLHAAFTSVDVKSYKKTSLFIIDPQVDFHPGGSLPVAGANADSRRIADMIKTHKHFIHEIFVSMDSHHPNHIAHAMFWMDKNGRKPAPFTEIRYADVKKGNWIPREQTQEVMDWCLYYTKALERKGRMRLTIWPEHCLIGSRGHNVVPSISEALQEWSAYSRRPVNYIMVGQNCRTEMYSVLEAEVVDPLDQSTALNNDVLSMLRIADRVRPPFSSSPSTSYRCSSFIASSLRTSLVPLR
jgi:nicotinamidase-related amidase